MGSNLSGKELLERMKRGDEDAFTSVYRQYHPSLYVYILRYCKIPSLAEDLVHDVFLKIWEIRGRIDPERPFTAYLYKIARNHVFKTLQKVATDRVLREQVLAQLNGGEAVQPGQLDTKEYDRLFHEALNHMPPQRLNVFRLCRQEGRSYDEAAEILGISRNAVKKHMVLSMRFIHDYVFRYGGVTLTILFLQKNIF
ncbi:RNA polymerase sigma-70 factor [Chitinophaga sp. YIM B06452]|uniref:RNA polymerase sigma factor n=1 Tax=Chitinophaga sp. YIM B06452 TaxID=3082158 RepID=UPI0031FEA635